MKQLGLALALEPVWNGDFWCCCPWMSRQHSLAWQPPDYRQGQCVYCGAIHTFDSAYGKKGNDEQS